MRGFFYLLVLSFGVWLALTGSLRLQEAAAGFGISLVLSLWLSAHYSPLGLPRPGLRRLFFAVIYLPVLFWEIVKANIDVAYRVVHPRMPIRPGVVVLKTRLKSDIARMVLANSITLTPGTFTLDVIGDTLLVHWINVRTEDPAEATRIIGGRFERYLMEIFE